MAPSAAALQAVPEGVALWVAMALRGFNGPEYRLARFLGMWKKGMVKGRPIRIRFSR